MSNQTSTTSGIGFSGALTIAFIILKLTGVINWAWIWVLSPIWISFAIVIIVIICVLIIAYFMEK